MGILDKYTIIGGAENREKHIMSKVQEHYDEAVALGYEVFCVALQGSQNYNLDMYTDEYKSDVDTKAILLPSFDDFCKGNKPTSTTHERANKEHIDLKDIRVMFETFKKQNVNFVEILFTPYYVVPEKYTEVWKQLQELGEMLVHCHPTQTVKTMAGMSFEKRKALCHPYPTIIDKIEKWGYDGKQLHHIIRVNAFMKQYISGVPFAQCLTTYDDDILALLQKAKLNQFSLADAIEIADYYDSQNNEIKNAFIEKHGDTIDPMPYQKLDEIKVELLRQWFREQLLK